MSRHLYPDTALRSENTVVSEEGGLPRSGLKGGCKNLAFDPHEARADVFA